MKTDYIEYNPTLNNNDNISDEVIEEAYSNLYYLTRNDMINWEIYKLKYIVHTEYDIIYYSPEVDIYLSFQLNMKYNESKIKNIHMYYGSTKTYLGSGTISNDLSARFNDKFCNINLLKIIDHILELDKIVAEAIRIADIQKGSEIKELFSNLSHGSTFIRQLHIDKLKL